MTTETEQPDEKEQKHPISPDIVHKIARDLNIKRELLDEVLNACEEVWEPYRSELDSALSVMGVAGDEYFVIRRDITGEDVTVISGADITMVHLLSRIDLEAKLETESVSRVGITHAVWAAHRRESKRLLQKVVHCPVVIRTPEFDP